MNTKTLPERSREPVFRVAIYARFSSEAQNEISIDDQIARCREEIARRGWRVAGVYHDNAKSGWSLDRDGFQQLRLAAEKGRFDAILFWKFDRLARDHNHIVMIKALLRHQFGLKLYCVEGISEDDDNSPYSALVEQMIAVFAAFYSKNLSSDTKRAKRAKAMRGEFNGSTAPIGYTLVTRKMATAEKPTGIYIDPVVGPVIKQAFERYATGNYSDVDMAQWLNEQPEVREARKGRKPLGKDTVRDLLQNRVYTGMIPYAETIYDGSSLGERKRSRRGRMTWFEGKHEGLISQKLFEECKEIRSSRTKTFKTARQMRSYILPDRVFCARCIAEDDQHYDDPNFGRMRIAWYSRINAAQYRCIARDRGYRACGQGYVREEHVLKQVVEMMTQLDVPADVMKRIEDLVKSREENEQALETVRELEKQMERVQYSWEQGLILPDQYISRIHQLEAEIASMRPLDYDKLEEAYDLITHFRSYWDQCGEMDDPIEARRQLLDKVIDRVFVYDDKVIAVALPTDFGIVLDVPHASPADVLAAVSPRFKMKSASTENSTRTQDGSDGDRTRDLRLDRPTC